MDDSPMKSFNLRIGTSGYDYPEWRGVFYPEGLSRKEYLGSYSERFGTLEINYTYYGQPKAETLASMLARTRQPIDFSVKAHQSLTHERNSATLSASVKEFRAGVEPLRKAERLAAVLLEFPFSFHHNPEERRYLARLLGEMEGLPLVVEFRNAEWYGARVIESLRERKVGLCVIDTPRLEGLPPLSDLVTSDIAYVRFHGRNAQSWWTGDAGTRYEYLYSRDELSGWIPRLESMGAQAKKTRVYFNNHRRGDAAKNAQELAFLVASAHLV